MRIFSAIILAFAVTMAVLFFSGIAVCILAIATSGNMVVIVPGAGLAIAFSFYCGYKIALGALKTPRSGRAPLDRSIYNPDKPLSYRPPPRRNANHPEDS